MGTEKRERQKANKAQRRIEEARAARSGAVKRNAVRWSIVGVLAVAAVVVIAWIGGAFGSDDEAAPVETVPVTIPETIPVTIPDVTEATADTVTDPTDVSAEDAAAVVPEMADPSECPATDGSEAPQQEFDEYPPFCIDVTKSYSAVVSTNLGDITVDLDAQQAPLAVNSFVTLARYHYFDGVPCHRIIPDFVAQCGDPTGTGRGGPGYSFDDELPEAGEYEIGSLAMANSGPDTNGSQFFVITGPNGAALPPQYTLFGQVTDGLDTTVTALDEVGNAEGNGVPPLEPVEITSVEIIET